MSIDRLISLMASSTANNAYIVIDLASASRAFQSLLLADPPAGSINLFADGGALNADAVTPWLVPIPLAERSIGLLSRSWELARHQPAVLWLKSRHDTPTVAAALASRLDVKSRDGQEWLLRFYDPRVLSDLRHDLRAQELADLLTPVHNWCFLDRDGALQTLEGDDDGVAATQPMQLCDESFDALSLSAEASQVSEAARVHWPDELHIPFGEKAQRLAKQVCIEAELAGCPSLNEKVLLLWRASADETNLFSRPEWQRWRVAPIATRPALQELLDTTHAI